MSQLIQEITDAVDKLGMLNDEIGQKYLNRIKEQMLTRDENAASHFCAYFLPYNSKTKKVFFIHHKKSGLWLSPGGHIEKGESLQQTLNREIKEELGMENFFTQNPNPFLLTVTEIENPLRTCKIHFDVWFLMETDGNNFNVDPQEFLNSKWLDISDAKKLNTDAANIKALEMVGAMQ